MGFFIQKKYPNTKFLTVLLIFTNKIPINSLRQAENYEILRSVLNFNPGESLGKATDRFNFTSENDEDLKYILKFSLEEPHGSSYKNDPNKNFNRSTDFY